MVLALLLSAKVGIYLLMIHLIFFIAILESISTTFFFNSMRIGYFQNLIR